MIIDLFCGNLLFVLKITTSRTSTRIQHILHEEEKIFQSRTENKNKNKNPFCLHDSLINTYTDFEIGLLFQYRNTIKRRLRRCRRRLTNNVRMNEK